MTIDEKLLNRAAEGIVTAQHQLACEHHYENNLAECIYWLDRASENGYAESQALLGYFYYKGEGVEADTGKAIAYLNLAAEKGSPFAQFVLGSCYSQGDVVEKDIGRAVFWWGKAASQDEVESMLHLGKCYYNGSGVEKDIDKAESLWRKAAENGLDEAQEILEMIELHKKGFLESLDIV